MPDQVLRILIIGAHPDDCEYKAGGTAALYRQLGHTVRFVSVTNGDAGHHEMENAELAQRRLFETVASGGICGVEYEVLGHHDGCLEPSIPVRFELIGLIREFRPDLILTHRPNDYHPDHRVTSQLVCDAAYLVTVPLISPNVPHLKVNPVIAFLSDDFQRPYPFQPHVVVDVTSVVEKIIDMHDAHVSQFYEWLPYNQGILDQVPTGPRERKEWLGEIVKQRLSNTANKYRDQLISRYGEAKARKIQYAEAFEGCEYGSPLTPENVLRLFPF